MFLASTSRHELSPRQLQDRFRVVKRDKDRERQQTLDVRSRRRHCSRCRWRLRAAPGAELNTAAPRLASLVTRCSAALIEMEETYIGNKIKKMHARERLSLNQGRSARKVNVMGMLAAKAAPLFSKTPPSF
jgi:hypothetical protein